jgi:hypothetical protein
MLIRFKTDGSGNSTGWYGEYSSLSPSWCQGLTALTEPTGTFNDGSGNFYYQSSATCMWRITSPGGEKIFLNFNYFDTEEGFDKVTIFDGTSKIDDFSGTQLPGTIVANSGIMFITWTTNTSNNFQGWEATYQIEGVGISENSQVKHLSVYPNPANDQLHLGFQVEEKGRIVVRLTNITGQTVYSEDISAFSGYYRKDLPVGDLPAGYYTLEILTSSGTTNKKILIN